MHLVITFNISYEVQFEIDIVFCRPKSNTILISRKVNLKKGNRVYITVLVHRIIK